MFTIQNVQQFEINEFYQQSDKNINTTYFGNEDNAEYWICNQPDE